MENLTGSAMRLHQMLTHRYNAAPITDEKCHCMQNRKHFWCIKNITGYHPVPVAPSAADRASFEVGKSFHFKFSQVGRQTWDLLGLSLIFSVYGSALDQSATAPPKSGKS